MIATLTSAEQQIGCGSASRFKFVIDIRERVAVLVPHDEAGVVTILDGPGRPEATGGHYFGTTLGTTSLGGHPVPSNSVAKSVAGSVPLPDHPVRSMKQGHCLAGGPKVARTGGRAAESDELYQRMSVSQEGAPRCQNSRKT